jgi:hypothetical protein
MSKLALVAAVAALAVPAAAHARATVDVMVVGKSRLLAGPKRVGLKARTVAVGGKRCAAGRATPLSALLGTGVRPIRVRDYGSCGRRLRDSGSLYVSRVGPDRARGRNGWTYKVGHRAGTTGAADPSGPCGDGRRLGHGQRVLWFWCALGARGSCQRTLEATPARAPGGGAMRVTVRGFDDAGRGVRVAGATVRLLGTGRTATTGPDGVATLRATPGRHRVVASKRGLVRSFPAAVRVR